MAELLCDEAVALTELRLLPWPIITTDCAWAIDIRDQQNSSKEIVFITNVGASCYKNSSFKLFFIKKKRSLFANKDRRVFLGLLS